MLISLLRAETIPVVTDPKRSNPSGFPIAITSSPTTRSSLFPKFAGVRSFALTFKTAISLSVS